MERSVIVVVFTVETVCTPASEVTLTDNQATVIRFLNPLFQACIASAKYQSALPLTSISPHNAYINISLHLKHCFIFLRLFYLPLFLTRTRVHTHAFSVKRELEHLTHEMSSP